ncbi:unnamed protein product [Cylicostephanus goldi]|uniref:Uncharacterized protein n=1 Tax=Cylicostephanus goldi TaxID=71465 RepID=A0A3P7N0G8_CYLGO|nr:unnamed protein product [Cylicostephanus goldi]
MDFWLQFNELQDQIAKSKRLNVVDGIRSKVALDVDVKCPTHIVLPLNQCSDQVVVVESDGLCLKNTFKPMSQVDDVFQKNCIDNDYGYDTSVDCLLDCAKAVLKEVRAYEGQRMVMPLRKEDQVRPSAYFFFLSTFSCFPLIFKHADNTDHALYLTREGRPKLPQKMGCIPS